MVKTKIIATVGPASSSETLIRKMVCAGLDVVRLNFSHGSFEEHFQRLEIARKINKKYRRSVKILADLEGHRIRIGKFRSHFQIELKKRQKIFLSNKQLPETIYFNYEGKISDIKIDNSIFIDDGNIHLKVKKIMKAQILAEVIVGGILKEKKGVNIPEADLKFAGLSDKDKECIIWALKNSVDYIAQSFVTQKEDVMEVSKFIDKYDLAAKQSRRPKIISKIENREGVKNLDEILGVSDGIMIARGDLGISIPVWEVPFVQKHIIKKCRIAHKPSITATQMLESMTESPMPTRAEVSDVANSIIDGTNFVMLSAETAVGKYPVESVKMMNQIIKFAENQGNG